ncbi:MAG TPA: PAS domain S-box protein [Actinomycetota bacterium]|nr:PAS domain S-box protein [Actinomycetota bacterium]
MLHDDAAVRGVTLETKARLVDLAHDAMIVRGVDGVVEMWNRGAEALYGYASAEAIGRVSHELLLTRFPVPLEGIAETLARDGDWVGELEHTTKDGRRVVVESRWALSHEDGRALVFEVNRELPRAAHRAERSDVLFRLLEDLPLGAFVVDAHGRPAYANKAAIELLGKGIDPDASVEDLARVYGAYVVGTDEHYPPERQPIVRALRGERCVADDLEIRRPDRTVQLEISAAPVLDHDGGVAYATAVFWDVTERKRAERLLADEEAGLRALVEAVPDAMVVVDAEGVVTLVNQQTEELFGHGRAELVGRPVETLIPEDRRDAHRRQRAAFQHAPTRRPMGRDMDLRGRRKDGAQFPVDISLAPLERADERLVIATIRDVTARERTHGLLAALGLVATSANEAASVEDALSVAIAAFLDALGWNFGGAYLLSDDEPGRLVHTDVVASTDRERYAAFAEASRRVVFRAGVGLPGRAIAERRIVAVDDSTVDETFLRQGAARRVGLHAGVAFPILAGSEAVGAVEFFADRPMRVDDEVLAAMEQAGVQLGRVVERARAERILEDRARDLERSNAELEQFAYVASHDLQEPLRMVASYVELLRSRYRGELDDDADTFIDFAVDGANRMRSLINDLLAYSRVQRRGGGLEPVDTGAVVDQAVSNLALAVADAGGRVTRDDVMPVVHGDVTQLVQLVQNLIGNAVKFRGESPPEVHVSAERRGAEWVFSVADNGIGISPAYAQRIFTIFERLHGPDEYTGTGIGLAICKRIVERHGGRIWVESREGAGATFRFTVPARTSIAESSPAGGLDDAREER